MITQKDKAAEKVDVLGPEGRHDVAEILKDVMDEKLIQRIDRIETALISLETQLSARLERNSERLDGIEAKIATPRGGVVRKITEKPNVRNALLGMMTKGWVSEPEALQKTGWQTIGVRSLITKLRTNGFSIEEEERDGVKYFRISK